MNVNVGKSIKKMRIDQKISIRDLAKKAKISPASLSNIERNMNSPTFESLTKICEALGIHMIDFLKINEVKEKLITRKLEREIINSTEDHRLSYELLNLFNSDFKMIAINMEPGCDFKYTVKDFPSDEIGLVIKGRMEIQVNDKLHLLEEGDSIYIQSNSEYKYRNAGEDKCISIWGIQGSK
jgi:transcriptional regulator with XRE-family HTH domain